MLKEWPEEYGGLPLLRCSPSRLKETRAYALKASAGEMETDRASLSKAGERVCLRSTRQQNPSLEQQPAACYGVESLLQAHRRTMGLRRGPAAGGLPGGGAAGCGRVGTVSSGLCWVL